MPLPPPHLLAADWFFGEPSNILGVVAVGLPAYIALIFLLRISGKRTLSKMNAFDLVITVAFGSMLASLLLSPDTTLAQGVVGFAFLILAQFVVTWLSTRSRRFQKLIKATPSLLYYRGQFLEPELRRQRFTPVEIEAAARQQGHPSLDSVTAVVLETDASLSIIATETTDNAETFARKISSEPRATSDHRW